MITRLMVRAVLVLWCSHLLFTSFWFGGQGSGWGQVVATGLLASLLQTLGFWALFSGRKRA